MSIKEKLKGWFSKQSKVTIPNKPYTSLGDLYGVTNNDYSILKTKLDEIENTLNNLPPPTQLPDLTPFAIKRENNSFSQQDIKDNAPYLAFRKSNNDRKGYVGVESASSNDMVLKAETNSIKLSANHNIILEAGNNYNIITNKTPTANNHVANKEYVDSQISNIPRPDLRNLAKTNESNTFRETNKFLKNVEIGTNDNPSQLILTSIPTMLPGGNNDPRPKNPLDLVTKEYVDTHNTRLNKLEDKIIKMYYVTNHVESLRWRKSDTASRDWYKYNFNQSSFSVTKPSVLSGRGVRFKINLRFMYNNQQWRTPIGVTFFGVMAGSIDRVSVYPQGFDVWSGIDYAPGSSGDQYINTEYTIEYWATDI